MTPATTHTPSTPLAPVGGRVRAAVALLMWLAVLLALLAGCGGLPSNNTPQEPVGAVVVLVVEEETNNPLQVPATVIVGGVRGVLNPNDQQLVLRNVPVGTGTPPTQPMTVSAAGYVTTATTVQLNVTTATWVQATVRPADTSITGTIAGVVSAFGSGEGVVNAFLQFFTEGDPDAEPISGFTDNQGGFIVGGIPMGANRLVVQAAGYLEATQRVIIIADDDGRTEDIQIELIGGDTRINVRGRVLDVLSRQPVEGASVKIDQLDAVLTGADGRFTVPDVLVGDHQLDVTHADYDPYRATISVLPGAAELVIELFERAHDPPGGPWTIGGVVTLTGAPDSSGATVTATLVGESSPTDTDLTDADGVYRLFVPPGRYRVTVRYQGNELSREVTVPEGGVAVGGINFALAVD